MGALMSKSNQFWDWWIAELSAIFYGVRKPPAIALALSADNVRLSDRKTGEVLASATFGAPDWDDNLEMMRQIAVRRVGDPPSVDLLLPREQTLFAEEIFSQEAAKSLRESAYWRLERVSGLKAADLRFDVSAPRTDARDGSILATVALTPEQTVLEALGYAKSWGFHPTRVSSSEVAADFPDGPTFHRADSDEPAQRPLKLAAAGLGALAALLLIVAGLRVYDARAGIAEDAERAASQTAISAEAAQGRADALRAMAQRAAAPTRHRRDAPEAWKIAAAVSAALPSGAALDAIRIEAGRLRIEGRAYRTDMVLNAIDSSPAFTAPRFSETTPTRGGQARFVLDANIKPGGAR